MAQIDWRMLAPYVAPLRAWWWLLVAATLLGATTSALIVQTQPARYQTRALVQVGGLLSDPNITAFENNVSRDVALSFIDVAREAPIRRVVAEQLGLDSLPEYDVQLLPGQTMIAVTVRARSAGLARDVATALAEALIAQSPSGIVAGNEERQRFLMEQLAKVEADIVATEAALAAEQSTLEAAATDAAVERAEERVTEQRQRLATLRNTYSALLSNAGSQSANSLTLFETAPVPLQPLPRRWGIVLLAALLGLTLAIGAAYVLPMPASRSAAVSS
jgi:uncharacterized protein involved in exopolysaccharide biosynthesis